MEDPINPSGKLIVKPGENLQDAPFNAPELINEVVNPPEPPLELRPPADPRTLTATTSAVEEVAPAGAVEVGGAGTGTWVWLSALAEGSPFVAGGLIILAAAAIIIPVYLAYRLYENNVESQQTLQDYHAYRLREDNLRYQKALDAAAELARKGLSDDNRDALDTAARASGEAKTRESTAAPKNNRPEFSVQGSDQTAVGAQRAACSFEGEWELNYDDGGQRRVSIVRDAMGLIYSVSGAPSARLQGAGETLKGDFPDDLSRARGDTGEPVPSIISSQVAGKVKYYVTLTLSNSSGAPCEIHLVEEQDHLRWRMQPDINGVPVPTGEYQIIPKGYRSTGVLRRSAAR